MWRGRIFGCNINEGFGMRVFVLLAFLLPAAIAAQAECLLVSDQTAYGENVELFSATQSGDRYETVTGRVLMKGTLEAAARLFSDVEGLPGWIANLAVAQEVEARSLTDRTLYMRFSAPLGFKDRDGVMRFVAAKEGPKVIVLTLEDIPRLPPKADAVRMKDVRGRFRVEQRSEGVLAVEFRLHYDSDATPVSLANLSVERQVKQTLRQMRQRIEGPLRDAGVDGALARSLGLR
jgi:hypothetical protein